MDLTKLLDLAKKVASEVNVPDLVERGTAIAADVASFAAEVRTNAARAEHVLTAGDRLELDAIHTEALAAADTLDAKLADAARR